MPSQGIIQKSTGAASSMVWRKDEGKGSENGANSTSDDLSAPVNPNGPDDPNEPNDPNGPDDPDDPDDPNEPEGSAHGMHNGITGLRLYPKGGTLPRQPIVDREGTIHVAVVNVSHMRRFFDGIAKKHPESREEEIRSAVQSALAMLEEQQP